MPAARSGRLSAHARCSLASSWPVSQRLRRRASPPPWLALSLRRSVRKADISLALGSGQIMCSLQGEERRLDAARARWLYCARYDADAADAVAGTDSGPAGPARSVRDLIERGTPRAGASPWLKEHQGPRVADPWPFFFVVARVGPRRV